VVGCDHCNQPSGNFLNCQSDYLLPKDSAPRSKLLNSSLLGIACRRNNKNYRSFGGICYLLLQILMLDFDHEEESNSLP